MLEGSAVLGLLPRFCVPLRQQGHLLGYLMVIDAGQTLTVEQVTAIERGARAVAAQLYAEQMSDDEFGLADSALHDLLTAGAPAREQARSLLVRNRLLHDAPFAVATVVVVESGTDTPAQVEVAFRAALR